MLLFFPFDLWSVFFYIFKMKLLLYKNSKSLFWSLIRLKQRLLGYWQFAQYSHVEICLDDNIFYPYETYTWELEGEGVVCFSSSEQDGGTRFKRIDLKPQNWDYIELKVSKRKQEKLLERAIEKNRQPYNWFWIFFAQILNINIKRERSWFCSEICTKLLQNIHLSDELCEESSLFISPARLSQILVEKNKYKIQTLTKNKEKIKTNIKL